MDELEPDFLAAALARAQDACTSLGEDSPLRSKLQSFLDALAPKLQLQRAHRGRKPSMKDACMRRCNDVDRLPDGHPLRAPRQVAYDRAEDLLAAGWVPFSGAERRQRLADSAASSRLMARPTPHASRPTPLTPLTPITPLTPP